MLYFVLCLAPLPLTGLDIANRGPDSLTFRFQWHDRTPFDYVTLQIATVDNPDVVLHTAEVGGRNRNRTYIILSWDVYCGIFNN